MSEKEKMLLIELILQDIRMDWNDYADYMPKFRAEKAKELCSDLSVLDVRFVVLKNEIDKYIAEIDLCGACDGRYFREDFPMGYYELDKLHGLNNTICDKSQSFKNCAITYLANPDFAFDDWCL